MCCPSPQLWSSLRAAPPSSGCWDGLLLFRKEEEREPRPAPCFPGRARSPSSAYSVTPSRLCPHLILYLRPTWGSGDLGPVLGLPLMGEWCRAGQGPPGSLRAPVCGRGIRRRPILPCLQMDRRGEEGQGTALKCPVPTEGLVSRTSNPEACLSPCADEEGDSGSQCGLPKPT